MSTAAHHAARPRFVRLLDWLFRSRVTGRITIGQWPNLSLTLFAVGYAIEWLLRPDGRAGLILWVVTRLFLGWWAADEMMRGVNPWRRILGALVLCYLARLFLREMG